MLTNTDLRIRVKIPIDAGLCVTCGEPRLSTDGKRVVCACGAETDVSQGRMPREAKTGPSTWRAAETPA